jgi:hypothetical protein
MEGKKMTSENGRSGRKDHGPQGTQVFSRDEVSELINEAASEESVHSRAELTGVSSGVSGQSFALTSTRIIVGRGDHCDLRLEDGSVSSEHARLVRDSGGWRIVNLLSTNGTFVNGQKVSSSAVKDGDRIGFGGGEFILHDPDESKASGSGMLWPIVLSAVGIALVAAIVAVAL